MCVCFIYFLYCASRNSSSCDDDVSRVPEQADVTAVDAWRIKFPYPLEQ